MMRWDLALTATAILSAAKASPVPEEWSATSPFSQFAPDDEGRFNDVYTSAFLNVSYHDNRGFHTDKTEVGRYGGGPIGPMFGRIVHVGSQRDRDDHTGCVLPLRDSNRDALPLSGEPWIALVKRGKCSFETKVENAFHSEAAGILIYNDRDSSQLDKLSLSTESFRNISAVFIFKWKGDELARLVRLHDEVMVYITVAGQTVSRSASINRTSVLFVSITFIILIIISLAWLIFYYVQRFRYSHARERFTKRLNSAAKKAICKIPTRMIKPGDKELQGDLECCPICIEAYKQGEVLRLLPCSHEYHKVCIDPWLLEHRTCPMCKMDILKHYGFVCSDSQESIIQVVESQTFNFSQNNPIGEINTIADIQEANHSSSDEDSRAPSPNEMTPSISRDNQSPKPSNEIFAINPSADEQSSSQAYY